MAERSGRKQLPDDVFAAVRGWLVREQAAGRSWRALATAAAKLGIAVSNEALRKAAAGEQGGRAVLDAVLALSGKSQPQLMKEFAASSPSASTELVARHAPPRLTPQRIVALDERYPTIALVFERMRQNGIEEKILDVARLALGVFKSDEGPTEEEVERAVMHELKERKRYREMIGRDIEDM